LGSFFVAKFGAKSSYGLLPLWIHHKIDKKTNIAQHSPRAARIFKKKTKMMGSSPPAQLGLPTMLAPFHFLVRFRQKREFKKLLKY
jgi:hypothetical protein